MRIISIKNLLDFCAKHPEAWGAVQAWIAEVKKAKWDSVHDILERYPRASPLGKKRVVFRLKGNDYRLIVGVAYNYKAVYIKFIGTHAQYDEIDAETVELE